MRTLAVLAFLAIACAGDTAHATAMFLGAALQETAGGVVPAAASDPASAVEPRDLLPDLSLEAPGADLDAWSGAGIDVLGPLGSEDADADIDAARSPACSDAFDNDGDGLTDYPHDPGCITPGAVTERPRCQDGADTDEDGAVDFDGGASQNGGGPLAPPDPQCAGAPWRDRERP
jgi:hypothetical protein